jgi:hypothetical protein
LSFIDVSQEWPNQSVTVLNLIASDFTPLEGLPPSVAKSALLDDLRAFLPFALVEEIATCEFQSHEQQPLFLNTVGAWAFRPRPATGLTNLFLAGDYCRNKADLVSMEGAIMTGLLAAKAVQERLTGHGDVVIREPESPNIMLLTGLLLFLSEALKCYDNDAFKPKMICLALAIVWTYTIHRKAVNSDVPGSGKLVAIVSLCLWFSVGIAGRAIGFVGRQLSAIP